MKKTVVLYPGLFVSHFVPMMQLADALLEEGYAVVLALIDDSTEQDTTFAAAIDRIASSKPSVTFHTLPRIQNPLTNHHHHRRDAATRVLRAHQALQRAARFFTTNATYVAVCLQLPWIRVEGQPGFKELGDATVNFRGVPPMPASHLLEDMLEDPESEAYKAMTHSDLKNLEADGILVNTFTSLEDRAVGALKDPQFLPKSELKMPPVYCVGPLVERAVDTKEKHECLAWLDEQPEHSVVFLCFGSAGTGNHSEAQLKEIAVGLERSGHRFLWVVRAPLGDNPEKELFGVHANPDLHTLLPEGFLERTKGRGLVVKLWVPQVDVLHHKATGAFVTRCGWNSVLEGITAGVSMLCWPLYAEQKMNKVFMVEEAGIGMEVVGWQEGLVKAEEVEAKVRLVLDSEEGEKLRARVTAQKEAAAAAWKNGGLSHRTFGRFLLDAGNLGKELRHA
ncbi:unnamed protein product [Urochloa decumbens]|uniref:Uncharacterized protein n=1 Tax=Urochloa decumbens TaxID=240449 RepID=A0ABC8WGL5_9POAL